MTTTDFSGRLVISCLRSQPINFSLVHLVVTVATGRLSIVCPSGAFDESVLRPSVDDDTSLTLGYSVGTFTDVLMNCHTFYDS